MDDDIATYLCHKGYAIKKQNISVEEQQLIRKELNCKPFVPKSSIIKPTTFPVYRESKSKLYVPRYYGIEMYGEPDDSPTSRSFRPDPERLRCFGHDVV